MRKVLVVALVCAALSGVAVAYTRITGVSGESPRWPTMPVSYWISAAGSSQIQNDSEFFAVQEAFRTWESVTTAAVQFNYSGTTPAGTVGRDGINLVSFSDPSIPLGDGTLAVTFLFYETQNGTPVIAEADILLNSIKSWVTSGDTNRYDIQGVMTHEVGHLLGLDHAGVMSSVMYPYGQRTVINHRFLKYDDMAGVSEIYPSSTALAGEIRASITKGSVPVFGAHVVALDRDGQPLVSTVSLADGSFRLRSLPAGSYRVYAEPFDGPVTEDSLGGLYTGLQTDFGPTFAGNVSTLAQARSVDVVAGQDPPVADIQVFPRPSNGLNVTGPAFPSFIARNTETGRGVAGTDVTSGVVVSSSSPSVLADVLNFYSDLGEPAAGVNVRVLPAAPLGPKSLIVNRGSDIAFSTGAIVVVDSKPSVGNVFPTRGTTDGFQLVSIPGQNFRAGVRVYFAGLPAPEVRLISSTLLDVTTPPSPVAGGASILVVNADGTSILESPAYIYDAGAPAITSVTPLSGPPGATVTIEGRNLDAAGLQVFFNGTVAKISTVTATRIVTAVPYTTTGDITVSEIRGPVFTVTSPASSSNRAVNTYNFVDASPQAGGTAISFSDPNDGVAAVTLPINFSLFRGAYAPGRQIAVSTNGWLSMDTSSSVVPEYMNAALTATGVNRPSRSGCMNSPATSGQIQRELIAPFFDDLVMVPGVSSVSARVVGTQPSRQFIVQWSKMGILDENACDVGASLTFQAVLYEESNDVMFVYDTMSGPRSSGASATIGMQTHSPSIRALMTSYNKPQARSRYFIAYTFQGGAYTRLLTDSTPPSPPDVRAASVQKELDSMRASWIADDLETGIREYQYAIGTSPGASDVVSFTSTTFNYANLTTPPLQNGGTYYFSVRAVNNEGLTGPAGFSNPIRIDSGFQVPTQVIPYAHWEPGRYTGIALLSPVSNSVQLRAMNNAGTLVATAYVNLVAGWQEARLFSDLFRLTSINSSFDGWIEVVPSAGGLGVFTVSGSSDNGDLDGAVSGVLSPDFVAMHPGASLVLVNPSTQSASVELRSIADGLVRSLSIPARGRATTTIASVSRVTSSVPLGALEILQGPGRLSLAEPTPVSSASSTLTFVHSVVGGGYSTTVVLVNLGASPQTLTLRFAEWTRQLQLAGNSASVFSLNDLLGNPQDTRVDAVRVSSDAASGDPGILLGAVDVENPVNRVSLGSRPLGTDWTFPHVAHGNGFFTGLALVSGNTETTVRIDIYSIRGDSRISGVVQMGPNQQLGKLLSELVPDFPIQSGGYIRVRSDQPILAWEVYGTPGAFVSGPPL